MFSKLAVLTLVCAAAPASGSAALELPPEVVARAWADIAKPSEVAKQRMALRALCAAARYAHLHDQHVTAASYSIHVCISALVRLQQALLLSYKPLVLLLTPSRGLVFVQRF